MDPTQILRASPLLQGFTDTGVGILGGICTERNYPAQSVVFAENMVSDSLIIIGDGRVNLSARSPNGQETPIGELGAGDWMGELSLINVGTRMCSATAATPVIAVEIRNSDFQKLMKVKPQACMKLIMAICTHFAHKVTLNRDAFRSLVGRM